MAAASGGWKRAQVIADADQSSRHTLLRDGA